MGETTLTTYSGYDLNFLEPSGRGMDVIDIAHSLSLQCRFVGQIPTFYSIAEHSIRVAWFLWDAKRPSLGRAGLFHDGAEAYLCDLPSPLKHLPEMQFYRDTENRILNEMCGKEEFDFPFPFPREVHAADQTLYRWECHSIRNGLVHGWTSNQAEEKFLETYEYMREDIHPW